MAVIIKNVSLNKLFLLSIILSLVLSFGCTTTSVHQQEAQVDVQEISAYIPGENKNIQMPDEDMFSNIDDNQEYTIGPKDVLNVKVWGHEDMNATAAVRRDGSVSLPLLGDVFVNGLTISEARKVVETLLAKDYLVSPNVDLSIEEYNSKSIFVFGDVKSPGEYKMKGYTSILDLIPLTGGTVGGLDKTMLITRKNSSENNLIKNKDNRTIERIAVKVVNLKRLLVHGDMSQNYGLKPDDIIYVYSPDQRGESESIYILGAVKSPGIYPYRNGVTALEAIILAGGLNELAAPNSTIVVRGQGDNKETYRVKIGNVMKYGNRSEDLSLEANDFVIVHEGWL